MKRVVVISGAGISADSGLKTFRDAGGLWEGHRVEEVATPEAFRRNPQLVLDFYNARRRQLSEVEPNAAHYAITDLAQKFDVQVITQNVDNLHERAGNPKVLHLHGELTKVRSSVDEDYVIDWEGDQTLQDRDPNGHPMRPFIVWFGEDVPMITQAMRMVSVAHIVIVVGTSLQVYPAASLLNYAPKMAKVYLVDPNPPALPAWIQVVADKAAVGMPKLVDTLLHG